MLDVAAIVVTTDVRAHCSTGNRTACRRDVLPATAADLVTENAADHSADNGARNIRAVIFPPLDPAALVSGTDDRAHRRDLRLEHALVAAPPVVVRLRLRRISRCGCNVSGRRRLR